MDCRSWIVDCGLGSANEVVGDRLWIVDRGVLIVDWALGCWFSFASGGSLRYLAP